MKKKNNKSKAFSQLRKRAEALLAEKPGAIQKMPPEDMRQLIQELNIYQIELEMQNEELRRAQLELDESRNRYLDLYDFAPVGYFTIDHNGLILEANLTGADLLGIERGNLIKNMFSRFIAPGFQDAFYHHLREVFETRTKQTCELKLVKKDGNPFYIQMESIPVQDKEGNFNQILTGIMDITELERTKKELEQTIERERRAKLICAALNNFVDLKSALVMVISHLKSLTRCEAVGIRLQEDGDYFYYVNKGFPEFFTKQAKGLCSKDSRRTHSAGEKGYLLECICRNVIHGGFDASLPFSTEKGSFWTNNTSALLDSISEKLQAKTKSYCNLFGYESVALIPVKTRDEIIGLIQLSDKKIDIFTEVLIAFLEMIGEHVGLAIQNSLTYTQLKEAEEALQKTYDMLQQQMRAEVRRMATVVKDSNDAVTMLNGKGNIMAWNLGAEKMYGYHEAEALKMNIYDIIPEEKHQEELDIISRIFQGQEVESFETTRLTKDGRTLDVWLTVTVLVDASGKPYAMATTERDMCPTRKSK
jgi:PAS domain S-box-containing protein